MSPTESSSAAAAFSAAGPAAAMLELVERLTGSLIARLPQGTPGEFEELFRGLAARPDRVAEIQSRYYRDHLELWRGLLTGEPSRSASTAQTTAQDRRFEADDWHVLPWFDYLRRAYLLNVGWVDDLLAAADLPQERKRRLAFRLHQYLDAAAPTNFAVTNPDVIRSAVRTQGHSLAQGLQHLRADLERGRIQMTDEAAFEVGRNIAVTPGAVVYQNAIAQLIQYTPTTAQVHETPLLIVPPFINKYYILDLQPQNSFVRYALDQGHRVFMVSWRNVPAEMGDSTWEDYIRHGIYDTLKAVREVTGSPRVNVLGFCIGGTLLVSALAVMSKRDRERMASLTLLATMLDFSDVGQIGVYIDEAFVQQEEIRFRSRGIMPGEQLAATFASLRANELIWYFVINNYLKGEKPRAFDLLFWNSDSANLPGRLYAWYLRNMYLENNLRVPGKLRLLDRPVDLGNVRCPAFIVATREDHIVPWRSAYASTQLLAGTIDFVLGASGHIAGVVNSPAGGRRNYWVGEATPANADDWLAQARSVPGSWWPCWSQWLRQHAGSSIDASGALGSTRHPVSEQAPGTYVRTASR